MIDPLMGINSIYTPLDMREQFRGRADGRGCQRFNDAHRAPRHILSSIHIGVEQKTGKISDGGVFVIALLFEFEIGFFSTFLATIKTTMSARADVVLAIRPLMNVLDKCEKE